MSHTNPEQIKQGIQQTFDLVASGYDTPSMRYFPFSADQLAMYLKPVRGEKILDVATGTGLVAIAIAQMLGSDGRVQAIDISDKMLDKAQAKINHAGLSNVDLHNMDAEQLQFKSKYFDAASCAFGLFFLPDMLRGASEILRVLKPGGRFMFSSFSSSAFNPMLELMLARLTTYGIEAGKDDWPRLASEADCQELLTEAGFTDIQIDKKQMGYHLASSLDWWEIIHNSALRGLFEQLEAPQQADFRKKHLAEVDQLKTDKGIWMDVDVLFTFGKRPD